MYFYIACDVKGLAKMHTYKVKPFMNCLANENAIAVGGALGEYQAFRNLHSDENIVFAAPYEGCMIHKGKVVQMKIAKI